MTSTDELGAVCDKKKLTCIIITKPKDVIN